MLWVLVGLLGLIAVLLIIAAFRPSRFSVSRSATIAAAPAAVFPHLEDFHRWQAWSPWEGLDPDMKRTFEGAERGVGAVYGWDGNKKAGAGRMEIVEARAPEALQIALHFTRPFSANNRIDFTVAPVDGGARVTWEMSGASPFIMRVFGIFMPMDKLVGRDFERGLAGLKQVAEAG